MGYDLHITRADNALNADQQPILFDEWRAYVESDPEMRMDNYPVAIVRNGPALRVDGDGVAVWTTYAGECVERSTVRFHYDDGRIAVENPDKQIIRKMKAIADHLQAHVVGEEGELY